MDKDITIAAQKMTIGLLAILLAAALMVALLIATKGNDMNRAAAEGVYYTRVRACVDGGYDWYVAIGDTDEYCIGHRGDLWYGEPYWR